MTSAADAGAVISLVERASSAQRATVALVILLGVSSLFSLAIGAADVSLLAVVAKLLRGEDLALIERVVMTDIRLPRLTLGIVVGAALAVAGAVLQGLFRNPLADPGIVGVSAGAGLGAISSIVLGSSLPSAFAVFFGTHLTPVCAFFGAWCTILLLYSVATRHGRTSVSTMLLGGIALGALAAALVGVLIYVADDQQLRELNFWTLGSLAGASWDKIMMAAPLILASTLLACSLGNGLNALALGEATAAHIGFPVQRLKNLAILCVALATGTAVAVSGGIGFIGIIVPHLLRLATGPDHRLLLINSAFLGAALLVLADIVARVIVAPAELPIGIVTAIMGAPVFLWILLRNRSLVDL